MIHNKKVAKGQVDNEVPHKLSQIDRRIGKTIGGQGIFSFLDDSLKPEAAVDDLAELMSNESMSEDLEAGAGQQQKGGLNRSQTNRSIKSATSRRSNKSKKSRKSNMSRGNSNTSEISQGGGVDGRAHPYDTFFGKRVRQEMQGHNCQLHGLSYTEFKSVNFLY